MKKCSMQKKIESFKKNEKSSNRIGYIQYKTPSDAFNAEGTIVDYLANDVFDWDFQEQRDPQHSDYILIYGKNSKRAKKVIDWIKQNTDNVIDGSVFESYKKSESAACRSFKKNEDTSDTARVWFCKHKDDDGIDEFAVFVDDYQNGYFGCYAHVGQHSEADPDYIAECTPIRKPKTTDLYKELVNVVGYDLIVCDTDTAEDIMGIQLNVSDAMRNRENPKDYDLSVENYEG